MAWRHLFEFNGTELEDLRDDLDNAVGYLRRMWEVGDGEALELGVALEYWRGQFTRGGDA
jgi:hypothetical protein